MPKIKDRDGRLMPARADQDLEMRGFIESVKELGLGEGFHDCLADQDEQKYKSLRALMFDVRYKNWSFQAKCRQAKVTLSDLHNIWKDYNLHKGLIRMATHTPKVMEDVAVDAQSRIVNCIKCNALGVIGEAEDQPCPDCFGEGKIRVAGDSESRKLMFETMGMTGKKGPMVAIQQNFGSGESLESLVGTAQKLLKPAAQTITVESE